MSRLMNEIELSVGSLADYKLLAGYHYRSGRPSTATRVLVLRHQHQSAADRMRARVKHLNEPTSATGVINRQAFGALDLPLKRPVRATVENSEASGCKKSGGVVGVLVESLPSLSCRLRDRVLGDRYRALRDARYRSRMLTDELRCISRVVIHPQWRGLGLAVKLVRAALADPVTVYTEAIAAMGQIHPFFERAGMVAHYRQPHEIDARLIQALQNAGFEPIDLARLQTLLLGIERLPHATRVWLKDEIRRWHAKAFRQSNAHATVGEQLSAAQIRLLCQPVYYIHDRRANQPTKPTEPVKELKRCP